MQLGVLPHFFVRNKLSRIVLLYRRRDFSQIATVWTIWSNFDRRIARHVNRIVLIQRKRLAVDFYNCFTAQADQTDLMIVAVELDRRIAGGKGDAAVMQVAGGCSGRRDSRAAPFDFVRLRTNRTLW